MRARSSCAADQGQTRGSGRRRADLELSLKFADPPAGKVKNLQSPNQPPRIVRMQFCRGRRIQLLQTAMEPGGLLQLGLALKLPAEVPIGCRALKDSPQQPF